MRQVHLPRAVQLRSEPFGAYVGVVVDAARVLHLNREVGRPLVLRWAEFASGRSTRVVVGYKRPYRAPVGARATDTARLPAAEPSVEDPKRYVNRFSATSPGGRACAVPVPSSRPRLVARARAGQRAAQARLDELVDTPAALLQRPFLCG
jgi:hypothetical protein